MTYLVTPSARRLVATTLVILGALWQPSSASAQAIVNVCNQAELVSKIFLARTNGGNGQVTFNCDGTIRLTNTIAFHVPALTNSLTNFVILDGTNHFITFSGPTTTNLTNSSHLFSIGAGMQVEFRNVRFINGRATNGGALWIASNATVFAQSCIFSNNAALGSNGVNGVAFTGQSSTGTGRDGGNGTAGVNAAGGAIYNLGSLALDRCAFLTNGVFGGTGGNGGEAGNGSIRGGTGGNGGRGGTAIGGAIYNQGTLVTTNCAFYINYAAGGLGGASGGAGTGVLGGYNGPGGTGGGAAGGAIFHARGSRGLNLNLTLAANIAVGGDSEQGGSNRGAGKRGAAGGQSSGGAVANHGTNAFFNSTFYANSVTGGQGGSGSEGSTRGGNGGGGGSGWGGGIFNGRYGVLDMIHCTIANGESSGGTNGAGGGGPLPGRAGSTGVSRGANIANSNGLFRITNSIVANAGRGTNGYGKRFYGVSNIISDRSLKSYAKIFHHADPKLETLANNGGLIETMRLGDGSPAINNATNQYVNVDARGVNRVIGSRADAGAYEWGVFLTAPRILLQPVSENAIRGNSVSFTVVAQGDPPLTYRWRKDNVVITNATGATYTIPRVTNSHAGSYDVEVSNNSGSVISDDAVLTVLIPATITRHPTNLFLSPGATASFSVAAEGAAPLTYQWLSNSTAIPGATLPTFTLTNVQPNFAATYAARVRNEYGVVISSNGVLTVTSTPPAMTLQPGNTVVLAGRTASFTADASGTLPLDYFWYLNSVADTNFLPPGFSSYGGGVTLEIANVQTSHEGNYGVVITNYGGSITSTFASLRVLVAAPQITQEPDDLTVGVGESALFRAGVYGSEPLFYQWFSNGVLLASATNSFLSLTNLGTNAEGNFALWVTNSAGFTNSREATLTISTNLPPVIIAQPESTFGALGDDVEFRVVATGTPRLFYQWFFDNEAITNNATATNALLVINNITTNHLGSYTVEITNEFGTVISDPGAVLHRIVTPNGFTISCEGDSCTVTVQNASDEFFYTLQKRDEAADAWLGIQTLAGENDELEFQFTLEPVSDDEDDYRVVMTEDAPIETEITEDPTDVTVVLGQDATFEVTAIGSEPLTYRWFFQGTNLLAGFEGSTLTISNAQPEDVGGYHVVAYGILGAATSIVAGLSVDLEPAAIATDPTNVTVYGTQTATFSVAAIGSSRTYQWFFNGSTPIPGATAATLTIPNVNATNAGDYHVVVANYFDTVASAPATLTVLDPSIAITAQPVDAGVYSGTSAAFAVTNSGLGPFSYQWFHEGTNLLSGATNAALTLTNVQTSNSGLYQVVITNTVGSVTSAPAMLTVTNAAPVITVVPADISEIPGIPITLSVGVVGSAPMTFQWYFTPLTNGIELTLTNATNAVLLLVPVQGDDLAWEGIYSVAITNAFGGTITLPGFGGSVDILGF